MSTRKEVEVVMMELLGINNIPIHHIGTFMKNISFNPDGTLINVELQNSGIRYLPDAFGSLEATGDVNLMNNLIHELPESFMNIQIGGDLYLAFNNMVLSDTFGFLRVGGSLYLHNTNLESLPDTFGYIQVGGNLHLGDNKLDKIPDSFEHIIVDGKIYLNENSIFVIPEVLKTSYFVDKIKIMAQREKDDVLRHEVDGAWRH